MFDKKQKSCVKRIHSVTDDGLYNRKAFYTVKTIFCSSFIQRIVQRDCNICTNNTEVGSKNRLGISCFS